MNKVMIRTENLHKTYSRGKVQTQALRGVDLSIPQGAFCAIIGPSGHGKSTLMHLIGGLDRPSSGRVLVGGDDLGQLSSSALAAFRAKRLGFVFQFFNLLPGLTAAENIETAIMLAGGPDKGHRQKARELLELVGLGDKAQSRSNELSGGQQQRVAIARALANDPEILLMDEPTGNLDSAAEAEVLATIDALHQRGKTIVIVTHDRDIAASAQMVVQVRDGRIS
jgi:putative ABC transport system ATP-binding protein